MKKINEIADQWAIVEVVDKVTISISRYPPNKNERQTLFNIMKNILNK